MLIPHLFHSDTSLYQKLVSSTPQNRSYWFDKCSGEFNLTDVVSLISFRILVTIEILSVTLSLFYSLPDLRTTLNDM